MTSPAPLSRVEPLFVVGLTREARIIAGRGRVVVGTANLAEALATRPSGLISFGLCGALDPDMRAGDLLIADGVVTVEERLAADPAWTSALRAAFPEARRGDMAAGGMIIATPADKAALRRASGATGVDMESHEVARMAKAAGLPFAVLRSVSDAAGRALPRAAQAGFKPDGEPDGAAVIGALARRPWELPALVRVAFEAEAAFKALARVAAGFPALPLYSAGSL